MLSAWYSCAVIEKLTEMDFSYSDAAVWLGIFCSRCYIIPCRFLICFILGVFFMARAEVTWSLMHPTPLDVEYMKKVVAKAAEYRVDSFEICADCHTDLGGMDGLTDYIDYPETHKRIDLDGIGSNKTKLREILDVAHSINKPVFYWHREAMVPDGLLLDRPDLLDSNGEFDLLGEAYADLLRYKIDSTFKAVPELDGLVLTLTEAT